MYSSEKLAELIISGIGQNKPLTEIYAAIDGVEKAEFYKTVLTLIKDEKIPNILMCYCRIDCSKCRVFIATVYNDTKLRQECINYYKSTLDMDISLEKLHNFSTRSDEIMEVCEGCPFMNCCREKGLNVCAECDEYPCKTLQWYKDKYVKKFYIWANGI